MANYSELLNDINAAIYENNDQEIDALEVRAILREMVASLGSGFLFKGIATPSSPGTSQAPDQNVFYLATTAGTYTYLGGLVVAAGEVAFLCCDGTWTKKSSALLSTGSIVDNTTTEDATKPLSAKQGKVLADAGAATAAEVTALGQKVDDLFRDSLSDFDIADENDNVVAHFQDGHIQTKKFNSKKAPFAEDSQQADFSVADENGNIVLAVYRGHLYTQYFSSEDSAKNGVINCFGDSITQGQVGLVAPNGTQVADNSYPKDLAELLGDGYKVYNYGYGGNTAFDIFSTMGITDLVFPSAFVLKADGTASAITSSGNDLKDTLADKVANKLLTQYRDSVALEAQRKCFVRGIPCVLSLSGGVYSIKREEAGDADIHIPAGETLHLRGPEFENAVYILFAGTNNVTFYTQNGGADWVEYMNSICSRISSGKYLILGIPCCDGNNQNVKATNALMRKEFGSRFIDLQMFFNSLESFEILGLTPTEDADISSARYDLGVRSDEYCMTNELTPSSYWRYAGTIDPTSTSDIDKTHLNGVAYQGIAYLVKSRISELNW